MCGQSHHSPHTPSQLPQQLFPKGQIPAQPGPHSLSCTRRRPTPKGSHLLLPPTGQAFGAINNSLASRQHLYVHLEVPSAASQTWEQGMEREMSLPGLTAPSSSYLQPRQDRTFLCPPSPCMPPSCSSFQLRCPRSCATARLCCSPSCSCPAQVLPDTLSPTRSALLPSPRTTACGWAVVRPQGDKEAPKAKWELQQQAKRLCYSFRGDPAEGQAEQTDGCLIGQDSAAGLSLLPPSLPFFFSSFNFVSEAMIL